jgi:hypothetical protein
MIRAVVTMLFVAVLLPGHWASAQSEAAKLRPGARVYVAEMADGFHDYFKEALQRKNVPLTVVGSKAEAEFEITGSSETQKAGAAKKVFLGSWHSDEQASISVAHIASGEVVFAYSANKKNSARGKRTSAEACAKHLKEQLEKR